MPAFYCLLSILPMNMFTNIPLLLLDHPVYRILQERELFLVLKMLPTFVFKDWLIFKYMFPNKFIFEKVLAQKLNVVVTDG